MASAGIKQVLDSHQKWINNEQNGEIADLSKADLREANLYKADLSWAVLRGANLYKADLCKAALRGANLYKANLYKADLSGANLYKADLKGVDLHDANLSEANLCKADLRGADLSGADFDFSCFPLWCGGSRFKCDTKLVYQILAHICTLDFLDDEGIKELIMPFAQKSHRAQDLRIRDKK